MLKKCSKVMSSLPTAQCLVYLFILHSRQTLLDLIIISRKYKLIPGGRKKKKKNNRNCLEKHYSV